MYFFRLSSIASIAVSILVYAQEQDWKVGQVVKTSSGDIQGHASSSTLSVSEYLGIPYAIPPTGPLRFAAPQAYKAEHNATLFIADKYVKIPSSYVLLLWQTS